ncbi:MAG: zinc ribbon domain-containing protein [Acidobacteriota bacterium]
MHCPKCGQQQVTEETRFCSRCGLLLTGIAEVVANDGVIRAQKTGLTGSVDSARRRGIKQGTFLFLLTFLLVPILVMLSIAANLKPFLPLLAVFLFGVGGVLRIVYALMFESGTGPSGVFEPRILSGSTTNAAALPPSQSMPASAYASPSGSSWRDTNDLQHQPGTVTDSTTKLLQPEDSDQ